MTKMFIEVDGEIVEIAASPPIAPGRMISIAVTTAQGLIWRCGIHPETGWSLSDPIPDIKSAEPQGNA